MANGERDLRDALRSQLESNATTLSESLPQFGETPSGVFMQSLLRNFPGAEEVEVSPQFGAGTTGFIGALAAAAQGPAAVDRQRRTIMDSHQRREEQKRFNVQQRDKTKFAKISVEEKMAELETEFTKAQEAERKRLAKEQLDLQRGIAASEGREADAGRRDQRAATEAAGVQTQRTRAKAQAARIAAQQYDQIVRSGALAGVPWDPNQTGRPIVGAITNDDTAVGALESYTRMLRQHPELQAYGALDPEGLDVLVAQQRQQFMEDYLIAREAGDIARGPQTGTAVAFNTGNELDDQLLNAVVGKEVVQRRQQLIDSMLGTNPQIVGDARDRAMDSMPETLVARMDNAIATNKQIGRELTSEEAIWFETYGLPVPGSTDFTAGANQLAIEEDIAASPVLASRGRGVVSASGEVRRATRRGGYRYVNGEWRLDPQSLLGKLETPDPGQLLGQGVTAALAAGNPLRTSVENMLNMQQIQSAAQTIVEQIHGIQPLDPAETRNEFDQILSAQAGKDITK